MWKRYRYDGDEEIIFLDTAEGARVLSPGDTVIVDDAHDLTGRPFTAVGGKLPDGLPEPPAAPEPPAPEPEPTVVPEDPTPTPDATPAPAPTESAPGAGSE